MNNPSDNIILDDNLQLGPLELAKRFIERLNEIDVVLAEKVVALTKEGFVLCLIGGGARSFLKDNKLPEDLDFEVRNNAWKDQSKRESNEKCELLLEKALSKFNQQSERQSFGVIKLDWPSLSKDGQKIWNLEFSLPRKESYDSGKVVFGHSDFESKIDVTLSYSESFSRRDLTINAFGVEFIDNHGNLLANVIDPFNGIQDFKQRTLREINDSFFLDPVRFLRLIRFEISQNYKIDQALRNKFGKFNLEKLTDFYFQKEWIRSGCAGFPFQFFSITNQYGIKIHAKFESVRNLEVWRTIKDHNNFGVIKSNSSSEIGCWLAFTCVSNAKLTREEMILIDHFLKNPENSFYQFEQIKRHEWLLMKMAKKDKSLLNEKEALLPVFKNLQRNPNLIAIASNLFNEWSVIKNAFQELQLMWKNIDFPSLNSREKSTIDMDKFSLALEKYLDQKHK